MAYGNASNVSANDIFASVHRQSTAGQSTGKATTPVEAPKKTETESWLNAYQTGDKKAASLLLKKLEPTIDRAVSYYANNDPAYKTRARILATGAFQTFDPSKGASLDTHVMNHLKRLQRVSAQRGNLTYIPESIAGQKSALDRAANEYELENGMEPTASELADFTGIPVKRINHVRSFHGTAAEGQLVNEEGQPLSTPTDHALDIYDRYIYDELDRTDKKIYEWTTGFGGAPVLQRSEMAKKLGISQAAVSQRASAIDQKMYRDRELLRKGLFGGA